MIKILNFLVICLFISSIGTLAPADSVHTKVIKIPIFEENSEIPLGFELTECRKYELDLEETVCIFTQYSFLELIQKRTPFVLAVVLTEQGTIEAYEGLELNNWVFNHALTDTQVLRTPKSRSMIQCIYYYLMYDPTKEFAFLCLSQPKIICNSEGDPEWLDYTFFNPYAAAQVQDIEPRDAYQLHNKYCKILFSAINDNFEAQKGVASLILKYWNLLGFSNLEAACKAAKYWLLRASRFDPVGFLLLGKLYDRFLSKPRKAFSAYCRAYENGVEEAFERIERLFPQIASNVDSSYDDAPTRLYHIPNNPEAGRNAIISINMGQAIEQNANTLGLKPEMAERYYERASRLHPIGDYLLAERRGHLLSPEEKLKHYAQSFLNGWAPAFQPLMELVAEKFEEAREELDNILVVQIELLEDVQIATLAKLYVTDTIVDPQIRKQLEDRIPEGLRDFLAALRQGNTLQDWAKAKRLLSSYVDGFQPAIEPLMQTTSEWYKIQKDNLHRSVTEALDSILDPISRALTLSLILTNGHLDAELLNTLLRKFSFKKRVQALLTLSVYLSIRRNLSPIRRSLRSFPPVLRETAGRPHHLSFSPQEAISYGAQEILEMALKLGENEAAFRLGEIYRKSDQVLSACKWYLRAYLGGFEEAFKPLSTLVDDLCRKTNLDFRVVNELERIENHTTLVLTKCAYICTLNSNFQSKLFQTITTDYPQAHIVIGLFYWLKKNNLATAKQHLEQAVTAGCPRAHLYLGDISLDKAQGVSRSIYRTKGKYSECIQKAYDHFTEAEAAGVPEASARLDELTKTHPDIVLYRRVRYSALCTVS